MKEGVSLVEVASPPEVPMRERLHTRSVSWTMLAMLVIGSSAFILLVLALQQTPALRALLGRSDAAQNAFFYAAELVVIVGGLLLGVARLRPSDVGLVPRKLLQGVVVTMTVWIVMQITAAVLDLITGHRPELAHQWTSSTGGSALLWLLVMVCGPGLFEDTVCRGFLYPQLYLKFRGSHRVRLAAALLASQSVFALQHIPGHVLVRHMSGREITMTVLAQGIAGVTLALLYLRTRNLWISIGLHGLWDAPTYLFTETMGVETFLPLLLITWPWLVRNPRQRGFAAVDTSTGEVESFLEILTTGIVRIPNPRREPERPALETLPDTDA